MEKRRSLPQDITRQHIAMNTNRAPEQISRKDAEPVGRIVIKGAWARKVRQESIAPLPQDDYAEHLIFAQGDVK